MTRAHEDDHRGQAHFQLSSSRIYQKKKKIKLHGLLVDDMRNRIYMREVYTLHAVSFAPWHSLYLLFLFFYPWTCAQLYHLKHPGGS